VLHRTCTLRRDSRLTGDVSPPEIRDRQNDIHVFDLERRAFVRLAPGASVESTPIWTPDGQRIVFSSRRDGGSSSVYAQAADEAGTVERLTTGADFQEPAWVAPDGSGLLGQEISPKTAGNIVWFPFTTQSRLHGQPQSDSAGIPMRLVNSPSSITRPRSPRMGAMSLISQRIRTR
jgi:Tol biopolymer transport system component